MLGLATVQHCAQQRSLSASMAEVAAVYPRPCRCRPRGPYCPSPKRGCRRPNATTGVVNPCIHKHYSTTRRPGAYLLFMPYFVLVPCE
ncbi:hypothetical protein BDA96_09G153400 [Sorghum bicolor]|uniref:Uncharacterized protein n=2 Tax=Sorghum bicolor TaxID=4558 RepID=A0A921QD70_SORBI|nr:hypothetical protein BDA96_09G153400 [Sorghum bicolor]KXG21677.1 hypothetical protein SORBI_3009G094600 [Sorghum bicolor]